MSFIQILGQPQPKRANVFWGEIAPCEHLVQIYEEDGTFLDFLEGFAAGGFEANESVIVVATRPHLLVLEDRLRHRGVSLNIARAKNQYLDFDAVTLLEKFMVNGWPHKVLFAETVSKLVSQAKADERRVRAFGEMVALLWARGESGAAVRLEHLWHQACHRDSFSLFCAYPRNGFTEDVDESIQEIHSLHSQVITACAA